jgi:hypothetical protein
MIAKLHIHRALFVGFATLAFVQPAYAQDTHFDLPGGEVTETISDGGISVPEANSDKSFLKRLSSSWPEDLVIAPVPGRSPQVGWSLALGGGYFLDSKDEDDESPPSVLGGFAWYAENGSYAYGLGGNLHLANDDVRVKFGGGYLDVQYRFYGIGSDAERGLSLNIIQEAPVYFASASYRVWKKLYLGIGYTGGSVDSRFKVGSDLAFLEFDPVLSVDIGAIAIPIVYDSRDHEQFPRQGWLISGRTMFYRKDAEAHFNAETFMISANKYLPVRDNAVLAFRAHFRTTSGDAPFFILSTFGGKSDLRGYPSGRYRDQMMYALQSEYRWQYNEKLIFTGFAGVGEVASDVGDFGKNFLPAAGLGARFVLSPKHRVSLSFDIATGKDGTEYYFGVGEAF